MNSDCEVLLQAVEKYIVQTEFENGKDDPKPFSVNFFMQQFNTFARPCKLMIEKLEEEFKSSNERLQDQLE